MHKILLFILILILLFVTALFFFMKNVDYLVSKSSYKIIQIIENRQGSIPGFKIGHVNFTGAQFKTMDTLVWYGVSCQLLLKRKIKPYVDDLLTVRMENVRIEFNIFSPKKISLIVEGLTVGKLNTKEELKQKIDNYPKRMEDGELRVEFILDYFKIGSIKAQFIDQAKKLSEVYKTGQTQIPMNFSGVSFFNINNQQIMAKIETQQEGNRFFLVVNKDFFKMTSKLLDEKLTDSEIEVLSKNPFRVTKLFEIRNFVRKEVKTQQAQNKETPEDAYRHVLWSYLLTREYGQEFAKKVTDAHEKGDIGNTKAEHQMDFNNNAIGREYAKNGFLMHELLNSMFQDSRVIRSVR